MHIAQEAWETSFSLRLLSALNSLDALTKSKIKIDLICQLLDAFDIRIDLENNTVNSLYLLTMTFVKAQLYKSCNDGSDS